MAIQWPESKTAMTAQDQFTLDLFSPAPSPDLLDTHDIQATHDLPDGCWVLPEIYHLYQDTDPEVWAEGVELFQEGVGFYRFYSLEELQAATTRAGYV
jgi:hypothetical protein